MTNPYESPPSAEACVTNRDNRRWSPGIWAFALAWPLVCICFHAVTSKLSLPGLLLQIGLPIGFYYLLIGLPVLFGYVVCIVAAVRYRSDRLERILRGVGAVILMIVSGNLWRVILELAFPRFF
jgi:hypothetical protein